MNYEYKLFEFNFYNSIPIAEEHHSDDEEDLPILISENEIKTDDKIFIIQMFGISETGEQCCIFVQDFKPFFYVKVPDDWYNNLSKLNQFKNKIISNFGEYYRDSIYCKYVKHEKLYSFDNNKQHSFIKIIFNNTNIYNKVKNLWYEQIQDDENEGEMTKKLIKGGLNFNGQLLQLYETAIPPLLKFFHIQEISPSGWIQLPERKYIELTGSSKLTTCAREFIISCTDIISLPNKESRVPYNIMSFDIEASSSHGDFPIPIKNYKKLATNIIDYFTLKYDYLNNQKNFDSHNDKIEYVQSELTNIIKTAFNTSTNPKPNIDIVYPKYPIENLDYSISELFSSTVKDIKKKSDLLELQKEELIESYFNKVETFSKEDNSNDDIPNDNDSSEDELIDNEIELTSSYSMKKHTYKSNVSDNIHIADLICDMNITRDDKINEIIRLFKNKKLFPPLEGDKITIIGSTFLRYGDIEPYLNTAYVLNSCSDIHELGQNTIVRSFDTERELLLAWTDLVNQQNPDIIIGYNISNFDYEFMFRRSQELNCVRDFLKLSKNKYEICGTFNKNTEQYDIDRSLIVLASGAYDLSMITQHGRMQLDLLNWFRKTENLISYKLDYTSGYYIGDKISRIKLSPETNSTIIYTKNMFGLQVSSYIHFEEINHSSDYYKNGAKFKVIEINWSDKCFTIQGLENPSAKILKWGLAKDDVSVKDIFRLTNEGPESRAIVAKYCIQDCNLVHHLFNKVDVMTDLIEMSKLCSVPMSFLIFRGQGIKLTSYVSKKCGEKNTLMPTIDKGSISDGYEGAIVLVPKCGLYLDRPVPVGDFASLYPSSMLSENYCPKSKVWSKTYNLNGDFLYEIGEKDENGNFIYDNIPEREYVNIKFDIYKYIRPKPGARPQKIKVGFRICRFVQPNIINGKEEKSVMPSILQELLKARKDTRKLQKTVDDAFIHNILEKRQLAYKATANSLYGQLGAKTSTFYEPDIAAATTATGRMLLTYAKRVVEECYANTDIDTKYGFVNTKSEYIYGDSVANYTPVYVKVNGYIDILTIEDLAIKYGGNNWIVCQEEGKQEKEFCELEGVESWSEQGWTKLYRVIRHQLAPHKKMVRVLTHTGLVDVTDDHSLLRPDGSEVSPKDINIGDELLDNPLLEKMIKYHDYYENDYFGEFIFHGPYRQLNASFYTNYLNSRQIKFKIEYDENTISITSTSIKYKNETRIKLIDEIKYSGYVYDLTTENHHFAAGVGNLIVHNTDSVFFTFNLSDKETGEKIVGEKALELSIEIAQEACHTVSKFLKQPHDFEYEKTFMPLCLLSKKRYVGMLYETNIHECKRKEMGIVLKRRDNAPIVKDVYGGIIDILMKDQNLEMAINYLNSCLRNLIDGNISTEKLIISLSLRSFYKNPQQIKQKVLADRIGEREPGNKPTSGDRIPFIYFVNNSKPPNGRKQLLQGDRIETPSFIRDNNLQIDYSYYITNQIMKPLLQLFGLVLEELWMRRTPSRPDKVADLKRKINTIMCDDDITDQKKIDAKISKIKNEQVQELLFDKYLIEIENKKNKNQPITNFFKVKPKASKK